MTELIDELAANVGNLIDVLSQYTDGKDEGTELVLRDGREVLERYRKEQER